MMIFAKHARVYWERGLSVIPIQPGTKQPSRLIKNWTGFCDNLPKQETRNAWLRDYSGHGIGLCLGTRVSPHSRIGAVDVDDDNFVNLVPAILGECPCAKRGKKGITYFVRFPYDGDLKSTKIATHDKKGAIDILLGGRMTVLPPTIHPETQHPYAWGSSPLLDTESDNLPILDQRKLALLRLVVGTEHAPAIATGKDTHEPGLRFTAQLVSHGCDDEAIVHIFTALLPESYAGNSLEEISGWIESARKKGFARPSPGQLPNKATAAERLVAHFDRSGASLFHDDAKRAYMSVPVGDGGVRHIALRSSEGGLWLTKMFFDANGKAIGSRPLDEAINLMEAKARFGAPQCTTYLRVGGTGDRIIVDLGHEDGRTVSIIPAGWHVGFDSEVKLVRSAGFGKLPTPIDAGENLKKLKKLLNLDDTQWVLVLAFILLCLRPRGPYMFLLIEGEQGSGKSFLCQILKRIIDPNQVEKARLPESERDLMIHAKDYYLLSFDNVSGMKGDLSDALCTLATGGGLATRRLYSDDELFVFNFARPMVINGIADFASRPDLLERAIILRLPTRTEEERKTEQEIVAEFDRILPGILGSLYSIIAGALGNRGNIVSSSKIRMADCARWLAACEPHTGLRPNMFIDIVATAQDDVSIERAQNDQVVGALFSLVERQPFEGTVLYLYQLMQATRSFDRHFPPTPAHLSRHLVRMKPAMAKAGIHFRFQAKTREGRIIRVWLNGMEIVPGVLPGMPPMY